MSLKPVFDCNIQSKGFKPIEKKNGLNLSGRPAIFGCNVLLKEQDPIEKKAYEFGLNLKSILFQDGVEDDEREQEEIAEVDHSIPSPIYYLDGNKHFSEEEYDSYSDDSNENSEED